MAAGQKTGGRVAGVPNKATQARQAAIAASGLTPLDYMLKLLRDESQPGDVRLDAAKAAAPYVHPRLAAVEMSGDVKLSADDVLAKLMADIASKGARLVDPAE